eukprot:4782500-Prymnesium_polylepis.1
MRATMEFPSRFEPAKTIWNGPCPATNSWTRPPTGVPQPPELYAWLAGPGHSQNPASAAALNRRAQTSGRWGESRSCG